MDFKPIPPPLSSRITTPAYEISPLGFMDLTASRASGDMIPFHGIGLPSHSHLYFADHKEAGLIAGSREGRIIQSSFSGSSDKIPDGVPTRDIHQPSISDIFAHPPHPLRGSSLPPVLPGSGSGCPAPRLETATLPYYPAFGSPEGRVPAPSGMDRIQTAGYGRPLPLANALDGGRQSTLGGRGGYYNCFLCHCGNFCKCLQYILCCCREKSF